MILGLIWGVWHLPAFFMLALSQSGLTFPLFLLGAVAVEFVATWVFLPTSWSVPSVVLLHDRFTSSIGLFGAPQIGVTLIAQLCWW